MPLSASRISLARASLLAELQTNRERLAATLPKQLERQQVRRVAFLDTALPEYGAMDAAGVLDSIESRHEEWLAWGETIA